MENYFKNIKQIINLYKKKYIKIHTNLWITVRNNKTDIKPIKLNKKNKNVKKHYLIMRYIKFYKIL